MLARKVFYIILLIIFPSFIALAGEPAVNQQLEIKKALGSRSHAFEQNMGQVRDMEGKPVPLVLFRINAGGLQTYITKKGITYVFSEVAKQQDEKEHLKLYRIDAELAGASIKNENIELLEKNDEGHSNYFYPFCPNGIYDVCEYKKIRIKNIYPGINWVLYINGQGIKYDFEVGPQSDPSLIKIIYHGAPKLGEMDDGSIKIKCAIGELTEQKPYSYQGDKPISTTYKVINDSIETFELGAYDKTNSLTIDPQLIWATIIGGYADEQFKSLHCDASGNLFVTGYTTSIDFPTVSAGTYYNDVYNGANGDVVILKFNSNYILQWSTFYGGSIFQSSGLSESGTALSISNTGDIYVTGYTNTPDFPCQNAGSNFNYGYNHGGYDAFLLRFRNDGVRLFATYIGGFNDDYAYDMTIDNNSNVFICGKTGSSNFPIHNGPGYNNSVYSYGGTDGFIMEFSTTGDLLWSTFFGGKALDICNSISADNSGNIFVTGTTGSSNFYLKDNGGYFQNTFHGFFDAFILKFNSSLLLEWSTLYGGKGSDCGISSVMDNQDNLIIAGTTTSADFPTYNNGSGFYNAKINGTGDTSYKDIFVSKFNNAGKQLWSTYYGGENNEFLSDTIYGTDMNFNDQLIADGCGNFYLSFFTHSLNITTVNPGCTSYFDDNLSIKEDCFITKFSPACNLTWASYVGGQSDREFGMSMAFDNHYNIIATGVTNKSFGFPFTQNGVAYFDNYVSAPSEDCFLIKFAQPKIDLGVSYQLCSSGCDGSAEVILNTACPSIYSYNWSNGASVKVINGLCAGNYSVTVTDINNCSSSVSVFNLGTGIHVFPVVSEYTCSFACTGSASIEMPGKTAFTYLWSTGQTGSSLNALCPGNYAVTVNDGGCGSTVAHFSISLPPPLLVLINSIDAPPSPTCLGWCKASASVLITGGATKAIISWSNNNKGTTAHGLCLDSTYTVTASDSLCYTTSVKVVIPPPPPLGVFTDSVRVCPCQSTASAFAFTGDGNYKYLWSNGETTMKAINLCEGKYTVTVSDSTCKPAFGHATIKHTPAIKIDTIYEEAPHCPNLCDAQGEISFSDYRFIGHPKYRWSDGEITNPALHLCLDSTYWVTVSDSCGNRDSDKITITVLPMKITAVTDLGCPGSCNNLGSVFVDNGTEPYKYNWSTGDTTDFVFNLCTDSTYTVTVTDACGKRDTGGFTVERYSLPKDSVHALVYTCPGDCKGVGVIRVYGLHTLPPFSFEWSSGSNDSLGYNLCSGVYYDITITDGCNVHTHDKVIFPYASKVHVDLGTAASCSRSCNGTAYAYTVGGIAPFIYTWSTGENSTLITNVCSQTSYGVTVSDACNSRDSNYVIIPLAAPLENVLHSSPHACLNACDGSAYVVSTGGTPPFLYTWSNGSADSTAANLCPDSTYSVIIFDPGCTLDTIVFKIPSFPVSPQINNKSINDCTPTCTGTATVSIASGVPPFYYNWSDGQTTQVATNLCPGNYMVTVSGCGFDTTRVTIGGTLKPISKIAVTDTLICNYDCNGKALATTMGASTPTTYHWSNSEAGPQASDLCSGPQFVVVNTQYCASDTILFSLPILSDIGFSTIYHFNPSCFGECNGSAEISVTGGSPPYTYLWTNGQTKANVTGLCFGNAVVKTTDSLGCTKTETIFTGQPTQLTVSHAYNEPHCNNPDGDISIFADGGSPSYSYLWSTGSIESTVKDLLPGLYSVVITDDSLCTVADTITLTGLYPTVRALDDTIILIGNSAPIRVTGAATYAWAPDYNINCTTCDNPVVTPRVTTTYCVIGIDTYGCADSSCLTVIVSTECGEATLPMAFSPNRDGHNDVFHVLGKCILEAHLIIYNRWGELVFESTDKSIGWDGTYKGKDADMGVYVYTLETNNELGQKLVKKGNVTLVR